MVRPLLSLSMIVRDAQESLADVLDDAASLCDELVIVDTGSTDATVEIARSFGAQVFHFEWIDDFSAARNFSLDQCTGRWILWLDADDRLTADAQRGFRAIREELPSLVDVDVIAVPYRYKFAATDPTVCVFALDRERLFRNRPGLRWTGRVHETVAHAPQHAVRRTDAWVEHRPTTDHTEASLLRNLRIIERCIEEDYDLDRVLRYHATSLVGLGRHEEALRIGELWLAQPHLLRSNEDRARYETILALADSAGILGREDKQLAMLGKAIAIDTTRAEAFFAIGLYYFAKQEWGRAIPFFAAVTELQVPAHPANPVLYAWLPWEHLANCAAMLGRYNDAIDYAARALPTHPERDRLLGNIRTYAEHA